MSPSAKNLSVNALRRWQIAAVCILLAALTWAVFGQTLRHDFVNFDDDVYVYENAIVKGGLTTQSVVQAFSRYQAGLPFHESVPNR
jgi:hypothetical protein